MPHADLKIRRGIEPHRILPRQENARDCPHALDGAATNVQPLVEYWGVLYYFIISRQQFIKLARAGHDWYVNGYKREKPVSQKSPAGFNLTWLKGEGEDANNHRIAFQNPLKGVKLEDAWENIWKD